MTLASNIPIFVVAVLVLFKAPGTTLRQVRNMSEVLCAAMCTVVDSLIVRNAVKLHDATIVPCHEHIPDKMSKV